ncbi:MAG: hypothetical protein ABW001_09130 [Mycobacterium sp.]
MTIDAVVFEVLGTADVARLRAAATLLGVTDVGAEIAAPLSQDS